MLKYISLTHHEASTKYWKIRIVTTTLTVLFRNHRSGPPFKNKFGQGFPLYLTLTPKYHLDPLSKENMHKGSAYISYFRMAENKKHFIHFENFYPALLLPKIYFDTFPNKNKKMGQGFPLYFSFYIWLKTKCISLILSKWSVLHSAPLNEKKKKTYLTLIIKVKVALT